MWKPALTAASLLAGVTLLAGCSSATQSEAEAPASSEPGKASSSVLGPAAAASPSIQRVDVAGFADVVAQPGVTVVDVRTPAEFASGHLEGAVNYDVEGADFAAQIKGLDPAGTYAVYCRSGNRSQVATQMMAASGLVTLYDLDGGINDWIAAGNPVVS